MMFAIDEINKDSSLLPNVSLGYRILDSCASPTNTLRAALTLVSSPEEIEPTAPCLPTISALIAESGSSQSLAVAGTLGPFRVPMVRATCFIHDGCLAILKRCTIPMRLISCNVCMSDV